MAKASKSAPVSRDAIVAAYMGLLADRRPGEIGLAEIAEAAGVTLAELRGQFGSAFDILAAFVKGIDEQVLEGLDADLADQDTKERLFDILMRRLDLLAPYKAAIRSLGDAARRDPSFAMGLNRLAVRSHQWMLAGAGVSTAGPAGALKAQGMAATFARVVKVWLDDEDPALARTMRKLDEELARAGRAARFLKDAERLAAPLKGLFALPKAFCERSWPRDRRKAREEGGRDGGWRGDDFRDPNVTPV